MNKQESIKNINEILNEIVSITNEMEPQRSKVAMLYDNILQLKGEFEDE